MSIKKESIAACSGCGERIEFTMYKSINVSDSPELKKKVTDGSLFLWKCPSCGKTNLARYDTLYHDPDRKVMVWLLQDDNVSESQMDSIALHAKAIGNYTLRRVSDTGSLMEKVLIFDSSLDDAVVEICKYVLKMEMCSKLADKDAAEELMNAPLHFFKLSGEEGDRILTFVYPDGGDMKNLNVGYNVYEDCMGIMERNPQLKPSEGFVKIDSEWLLQYFR